MTIPEKRNPGWRAGASGSSLGERKFHVDHASAEPLLQRLEGVQRSGNGWRARCPACGGRGRKLSVTEREGRVLVHCFGCGDADGVLAAVGLSWADLHPPRHWPDGPEERRVASRALRESSWASALEVLVLEARVALVAARQLATWRTLSEEDDARLALAVKRIDGAANALCSGRAWRPEVRA